MPKRLLYRNPTPLFTTLREMTYDYIRNIAKKIEAFTDIKNFTGTLHGTGAPHPF
jgi:hypothetical protein